MIAPELGAGHGEEGVGAVDKGRRGAQGHQRIHIGRTVPEALIAGDEKLLVDDHDDGCQQQLQKPHGHVVLREKSWNRPAPHHVAHGEIHQNRQKAHRPQQPPLEGWCLMVLERLLRLGGGRLCRALFRGTVAGLLHRLDNGLRRGSALHAHGVGQKAHGTGSHARHLGHSLFHPSAASRAAHTRDVILFHRAATSQFDTASTGRLYTPCGYLYHIPPGRICQSLIFSASAFAAWPTAHQ